MLAILFAVSCVVPFEASVFDGEVYFGPNEAGRWDIYYPAYSSGWNVEVELTGVESTFDLVTAAGILDWEDYLVKVGNPMYLIFYESLNTSEVNVIFEMDLTSSRTVRILYRTHESGVTFTGFIIGRCLAFRYLGWGNVYDHL